MHKKIKVNSIYLLTAASPMSYNVDCIIIYLISGSINL